MKSLPRMFSISTDIHHMDSTHFLVEIRSKFQIRRIVLSLFNLEQNQPHW